MKSKLQAFIFRLITSFIADVSVDSPKRKFMCVARQKIVDAHPVHTRRHWTSKVEHATRQNRIQLATKHAWRTAIAEEKIALRHIRKLQVKAVLAKIDRFLSAFRFNTLQTSRVTA